MLTWTNKSKADRAYVDRKVNIILGCRDVWRCLQSNIHHSSSKQIQSKQDDFKILLSEQLNVLESGNI